MLRPGPPRFAPQVPEVRVPLLDANLGVHESRLQPPLLRERVHRRCLGAECAGTALREKYKGSNKTVTQKLRLLPIASH